MTAFESWEYQDPMNVAISRQQARIKRERAGKKPVERRAGCDGCGHYAIAFERPVCLMGKKRFIRCNLFIRSTGGV